MICKFPNFKFKISNSHSGFTLMEMLITVAVVSIGVLGIYGALYPMLVASRTTSLRLTAAYLAQEGLEIVRNIRDTNVHNSQTWSKGLLDCELGCQIEYAAGNAPLQPYKQNEFLKVGNNGFYGYGEGRQTSFTRKITIHAVSADILNIAVAVSFKNSSASSQFELKTYLYNYQ